MQDLTWYVKRLRSMTPAEIGWRLTTAARRAGELGVYLAGYEPGRRLRPPAALADYPSPFRVSPTAVGELASIERAQPWIETLERRAAEIASGHLSFFDLEHVHLGEPIDWHRDHLANRSAPTSLIHLIDYRDEQKVGDCKLVWEPNRHHQFVVLARAYRATGRLEHARALATQLGSWLDANPFAHGMNWRSPLELGVRMINWVWALDLVKESGAIDGELWTRVYRSIHQHCLETARNYSRGSSANNHLIGEAAGVFVATAYFDTLPAAEARRAEAKAILEREILLQTFDDGCTREHATGYQCFVAQLFTACRHAASLRGDAFSAAFDERLGAMFDFLAKLTEAGPLPLVGDSDDGYALDLGDGPRRISAWSEVRRQLLGPGSRTPSPTEPPETVYWLFGAAALEAAAEGPANAETPLESWSSPAGYCLLQAGRRGARNLSVLFDCADLGYGSLAAHGHADALSIVLRADGQCILVDPGTYDYFSYPEWRGYFRSTAAHNTIRVDGLDQSIMTGRFMWERPAETRLLAWAAHENLVEAAGEHTGYARLEDPLVHRRALGLELAAQRLTIEDTLSCAAEHTVEILWHVAPDCGVEQIDASTVRLTLGDTALELTSDPALSLTVHEAGADGFLGWISDGYHIKRAGRTLIAAGRIEGTSTFTTTIVRD